MVKAKTKSKAQVVDKWKKKRWHKIIAPKIFNEQVIGDTIALDSSMVSGRTITTNLMHLTRDMKKQNINMVLEIDRVMGDTAYTSVKKFEMVPSSIKRFVRRGKHRFDDSFVCLTADNKRVRLKPFLIGIGTIKSSVLKDLRSKVRNFIALRVKKTPADLLVQDIINHKLQKELKMAVKKTFPMRICEIRQLVFEKQKKKEDEEEKTEEVKTETTTEKKVEEKAEKTEAKPEEAKEKPKEEKKAEEKPVKEEKKVEEKTEEKPAKEVKPVEKTEKDSKE